MNVGKESTGYKKFVGVGQFKVLKFNPTRAELNKILNYEPEGEQKELEYTKDDYVLKYRDQEGNEHELTCKQVYVDVWLEEQKTKTKHKVRFTITNQVRTSKDARKSQWINQVGKTTWVDEESNLPEWFTHFKTTDRQTKAVSTTPKVYREAFIGEENLYDFLAKWLEINSFNATNNMFIDDMNKFWNGNMKELNTLIDVFEDNTIMCILGIKNKQVVDEKGNTEDKEYQTISTRYFCPGRFMKIFRNMYEFAQDKRNAIEEIKADKKLYDLGKFISESMDEENGFKDFFLMQEVVEYTPEMNELSKTNSSIVDNDSSY